MVLDTSCLRNKSKGVVEGSRPHLAGNIEGVIGVDSKRVEGAVLARLLDDAQAGVGLQVPHAQGAAADAVQAPGRYVQPLNRPAVPRQRAHASSLLQIPCLHTQHDVFIDLPNIPLQHSPRH